jgi:hypothetical protein
MLKLTVAMVAFTLAGAASAANWKDLRVDGSSEAAFAHSLAAFKDKLSPARQQVFGEALKDIWVKGVKAAEAEQRQYTANDYYAQLDGMGYEEVVTLADPTGEITRARYREANLSARARAPQNPSLARPPAWTSPPAPIGPTGEQRRGGNYTHPMQ